MRLRLSIAVVMLLGAGLLAACGGDSDDDGAAAPTQAAAQPTSPPAAQPTTAPTPRPVVVTQAMLAQIGISAQEVAGLYGSTQFAQNRTNVTDLTTAFASSPELMQLVGGPNISGSYNAWTATGQCVVCAVQVPVIVFANEAAATSAYGSIRQVNQAIFQNVQPATGFSSYWSNSFCQNGTFTTQQGVTLNWLFCAAQKGNAVFTIAIGGFNFNQGQVGDAVRAYATRVEGYLKTQFP